LKSVHLGTRRRRWVAVFRDVMLCSTENNLTRCRAPEISITWSWEPARGEDVKGEGGGDVLSVHCSFRRLRRWSATEFFCVAEFMTDLVLTETPDTPRCITSISSPARRATTPASRSSPGSTVCLRNAKDKNWSELAWVL
jgi:hypothetical protein